MLLLSANARAYPYFVGLRHSSCGECHYSPTGGGLVNDWGRANRGVTLGGPDDWSVHTDAQGQDTAGHPQLQADFGADARLLTLLPINANVGSRALLIPMLIEAQAVAAYGGWEAYASVTPRPGTPAAPYLAFSREHWLLLRLADELTLRLGRLVLPFGIRAPDHTQASLLGSHSEARDRLAGSLFAGLRPFDQSYLLAELAVQRFWAVDAEQTLGTGATFLRLGWFPADAVDVYTEAGYRRIFDHPELTRVHASLGTNWQLSSWLELVPSVKLEHRNGVGSEVVFLGQLHLMH